MNESPPFNDNLDEKLHDAINFLQKRFNHSTLSFYDVLHEILFLGDWKHVLENRNHITHLEWINRGHVPYSRKLQKLIDHILKSPDSFQEMFVDHVIKNFNIFGKDDSNLNDLEKETLNQTINCFNKNVEDHDDLRTLVDSTYPIHNTEPGKSLKLKKWAQRQILWEQRYKEFLSNFDYLNFE